MLLPHTHTLTHTHTYAHTYTHTNTHTHTHIYHTNTCTRTYSHTHTHMAHTITHTHITHTNIHSHTQTYTHTPHTHRQIQEVFLEVFWLVQIHDVCEQSSHCVCVCRWVMSSTCQWPSCTARHAAFISMMMIVIISILLLLSLLLLLLSLLVLLLLLYLTGDIPTHGFFFDSFVSIAFLSVLFSLCVSVLAYVFVFWVFYTKNIPPF